MPTITRNGRGHFLTVEGPTSQEDTTILSGPVFNDRISTHLKPNVAEL